MVERKNSKECLVAGAVPVANPLVEILVFGSIQPVNAGLHPCAAQPQFGSSETKIT